MSCWKCQTSFIEGYEYCLSCDANIHAYCIICYEPIRCAKVSDVHSLWDDNGWSGRPVCSDCYIILKDKVPNKLDVPIKREKPKKRGLEVWMY